MIKVYFELCTKYEPGEDAPPQINIEESVFIYVKSVPCFKDRLIRKGHTYVTWDIKHNLDDETIFVRGVRRITQPTKRDPR